jgi:hypothetical protein
LSISCSNFLRQRSVNHTFIVGPAVIDAYLRLIVDWSAADQMRAELVNDALGIRSLTPRWRRPCYIEMSQNS